MKLVVTGCAGFIGINFSRYWLNRYPEDKMIGIDCLTYAANLSVLGEIRKNGNFTFYKENICNKKEVGTIFEKERPDLVINFAAESHVDRSIATPDIFLKTNVFGTQVLLDSCLQYGVKRFHQISTDEVYGDLPIGSKEGFAEDSPLKPSSPYSASKAAADLLTLAYARTYGLPVSISRSSNNYGAFQHEEKFIPKTIKRAIAGMRIPIYGDGKNVRDWLHVNDHCRAIDFVVRKGRIGEIYNIGGGCELSNVELARKILETTGRAETLFEYVADRKGHDRRYSLDTTKIKNELGWMPEISFEEGLGQTVGWYKT